MSIKSSLPHVVIIGGGFGGLNAAKELAISPVRITLIDRKNHHLFQPLLYQVATAGLSPADIAVPIRHILRKQKNLEVLLAEVTQIDIAGKKVITNVGDINYDYLIIATGSRHSYFGKDEWEQNAPGLKTLEDALEIRKRILYAFELAEIAKTPEEKNIALTFVLVGGGPTGVELAGAIAEIARFALAKDFRHIDPTHARIILFEGGPRILPAYPENLSNKATRQLESLGVQVRCNARVTRITDKDVEVNEEIIPSYTILWSAGNVSSPLGKYLGVPLDRAGRVIVQQDLSIPGHQEIQVIGDLACFTKPDGKILPGVAQVAIQQGKHAARNIRNIIEGKPTSGFHYNDYGNMATIGRNRAIADLNFAQFSGFIAWLLWLFIHILWLIGYRNRLIVLLEWAWAYMSYSKGARLITGKLYYPKKDS